MKKSLLLLFCLNTFFLKAQNFEQGKGKAVIFFEPNKNVIVRLDTLLIKQTSTPIILAEGKYVLRAWAPTKQLFTDTITIRENQTTIFTHHLKNSTEYSIYKKKLSRYKIKKISTQMLPIPLTLGYSAFMFTKYNTNNKLLNKHLENAKTASTNYENSLSIEDKDKYKLEYDIEKSNYETYRNKNNKIVKVATVSTSIGIIASAALLYLSRKIIKPEFKEVPLLSLNTISFENDYTHNYSISIVVNINR